jgi:hypothetical protein
MGEEFYCCMKLVSGEEIFSLISVDENDGDPIIILQNPVIVEIIQNNRGSFMKIKPWMTVPDDDLFFIKLDKVITMTEIKDNMVIDCYCKYLNNGEDHYDANGKVKVSDKMGFISTVEDARKNLEKIFNNLKDT